VIANLKDQPDNPGLNPYVLQRIIDLTMTTQDDPHTALIGNTTPAILLKGECDFVPWKAALEYRKTFANLKIFYIPKAGHYIQFEQPALMTKVIRSFLLDQPDAIPPYIRDADPRPPAN
jgi:pimeloyl-ACP methyl ester carboxylesterase